MGKAGRTRKHTEKMKAKRSAKAARRALYQSMAGTSKKAKKQNKKPEFNQFSATKHKHLVSNCGNTGCSRCFPQFKAA